MATEATTTTVTTTIVPISARDKKINNITGIGSSVGFAGGLIYAFKKGKGFWGYVGFGILFSIIGGAGAKIIGHVVVPEEKPVATVITEKKDK